MARVNAGFCMLTEVGGDERAEEDQRDGQVDSEGDIAEFLAVEWDADSAADGRSGGAHEGIQREKKPWCGARQKVAITPAKPEVDGCCR